MRRRRSSGLWIGVVTALLATGSAAIVFSGDAGGAEAETPAAGATESKFESKEPKEPKSEGLVHVPVRPNDDGCLADAGTLEDLKRARAELEAKQRQLAAQEADIRARELALADQLKQLAEVRADLEKIEGARKAENDTKVAKLVETVEVMNPKAAATLLGSIDEGLAAGTMARLSTAKLSKVMNVMEVSRSSKLSEILAGVARAKTRTTASTSMSKDAAAATLERAPSSTRQHASEPSKGGERK